MKLLYLNCSMGAAGDMLSAALLELFPHPETILQELQALEIPHVTFSMEKSKKCGIVGTHLSVKIHGEEESAADDSHHHHHDHSHATLHSIEHLLEHLNLTPKLRQEVLSVYQLIAEAESTVHQVPVSEIHFHEVGALDAVADITAACLLMDKLSPDQVIVSPIHVGSGQVRCVHGILPVPAPATAHLLQGCPIYSGNIRGELCTPTGAALLKHFADSFGELPPMKLSAIGYGMGNKDFEAANCLCAMLGETDECKEEMYELNCNVDDMTGEEIGFALERCFEAGAVEAFTIPIQMKKSRPGTLIRVLCSAALKEQLIHTIFLHTSTAGIRESKVTRSILNRSITETETPYGIVRRKDYEGYGVKRAKYEYEDLARIAKNQQISISEVLKNIEG